MKIINRDGNIENWNTNHIREKLKKLCSITPDISKDINIDYIVGLSIQSIRQEIENEMSKNSSKVLDFTSQEIDLAIANYCMQHNIPRAKLIHQYLDLIHTAGVSTEKISDYEGHDELVHIGNPQYGVLASRILTSCLQKHTPKKFSDIFQIFYKQIVDEPEFMETEERTRMGISEDIIKFVLQHKDKLNSAIKPKRDYAYTYGAYSVMFTGYLYSTWLYPPYTGDRNPEEEEEEQDEKNQKQREKKNNNSEQVKNDSNEPNNDELGKRISLNEFNRYTFFHMDHQICRDVRKEGSYIMFGKKRSVEEGDLPLTFGAQHVVLETPQMMHMRLAVCQYYEDGIDAVLYAYEMNSSGKVCYATPQYMNYGRKLQGIFSCFIYRSYDDLKQIYDLTKDVALGSKSNGGIGFNWNLREAGRLISTTSGISSDVTKPLRVIKATGDYVTQGGGKRDSSISPQIWLFHPSVQIFMKSKDELRSNDIEDLQTLNHGLLIPGFFNELLFEETPPDQMNSERKNFYFFSVMDEPELYSTCGKKQKEIYLKAVQKCKEIDQKYSPKRPYATFMNVYKLWDKIKDLLTRKTIYLVNLDEANQKSNFTHLPVEEYTEIPIGSTNLCTEIFLPTNKNEIACCVLGTIILSAFAIFNESTNEWYFDFDDFSNAVRFLTRSLNKAIDKHHYVCEKMKTSNMKHRPLGMGKQGHYDLFYKMRLYSKKDQRSLNRLISECYYYSALYESNVLAKRDGYYPAFPGSNYSKGIFQMDLWGLKEEEYNNFIHEDKSNILKTARKNGVTFKPNYAELRSNVKKYGTRNGQLTAQPPTASTSVIWNSSPANNPYHSFAYQVVKNCGTIFVFNQYLIRDLQEEGLFTREILNKINKNHGSIQNIDEISEKTRSLYKTGFELHDSKKKIRQELIIPLYDRAIYTDQGEPANLFMKDFNDELFNYYYGCTVSCGFKTNLYYIYNRGVLAELPEIDEDILKKSSSSSSTSSSSSSSSSSVSDDNQKINTVAGESVKYDKVSKIRERISFKDSASCDPSCEGCGS